MVDLVDLDTPREDRIQTSRIDCETNFYRFWKTFFKVVVILVESPFLSSKPILGVREKIWRLGKKFSHSSGKS